MRINEKTLPLIAERVHTGRVVVFDTETTGGASFDEICQIAAAEYVGGAPSRTLALYICPTCPVNPWAEAVHGEVRPLKPRHTEMVPEHDKYVGGKQYFIESVRADSMYHSVFHPLSTDCVDVLGHRDQRYLTNIASAKNLGDFRYAVVQYLVGTAIRSVQEARRDKLYRSSMIVHVEIAKSAHEWQCKLLEAFLEHLLRHVFCRRPDDNSFDGMVAAIYEDFAETRRNGEAEGLLEKDMMPSLMAVIEKIKDLFVETKIHVQIVNSDEDVENLLDETGQLALRHEANIFIGGSIIDRGLTIENLIGFVYGRSPQQMQMDTVLQHARMYGARKMADMAVTRFHTTNQLHDRLRRINAMDESLRDQFEQAMRDGRDPTSLFICRDAKGQINPCAPSKLLISSISTIAPHSRHLPVGFQTDCQTTIQKVISEIDSDILRAPDYQNRDGDGIFMIDRDLAIDILRRIRLTYIYNRPIDANKGLEWDVEETIGILEWALDKNHQLYCLRRENREMSRLRANGGFIDAPDDGRTDLAPARAKAIDLPLLMLIKENGAASKGWRDAPFYWPVLLIQKNVRAAVYGNEGK